jgi:hypothetical protein
VPIAEAAAHLDMREATIINMITARTLAGYVDWGELEHPQAAAELWTHIGRRLRGQPRAEALTIAAVSYCLLGDAIRAGIATDAALDEAEATHCPTPRLAVLLQAALRAGIPPQQIRRILADIEPKPKQD